MSYYSVTAAERVLVTAKKERYGKYNYQSATDNQLVNVELLKLVNH